MDKIEIVYKEKPESISWEQISDVLVRSHEANRRRGIVLPYPHLPPAEMQKKVERKNGKLFVAMDGDRVVGTAAVLFIKKRLWCGSGSYAYCCLASVLPEYAGHGIYRKLLDTEDAFILSQGYKRILFDSDERNTRIFEVSLKNGYKFVDYRIRPTHRSILMVKWLGKPPYPDFVFTTMFAVMKRLRILKHKLGKHR